MTKAGNTWTGWNISRLDLKGFLLTRSVAEYTDLGEAAGDEERFL